MRFLLAVIALFNGVITKATDCFSTGIGDNPTNNARAIHPVAIRTSSSGLVTIYNRLFLYTTILFSRNTSGTLFIFFTQNQNYPIKRGTYSMLLKPALTGKSIRRKGRLSVR